MKKTTLFWLLTFIIPCIVYLTAPQDVSPKLPLYMAMTSMAVTAWVFNIFPAIGVAALLTFGYLLETAHSRVAWLSDTAGLPEKTLKFLRNNQPQVMVMDCSHPPRADAPRNHCDLNTVLALNQVIRSPRVILTHISHQFDAWLMENALPSGFEVGFDGMEIGVA